jgi:guanyl-specific ribonuclease Sa
MVDQRLPELSDDQRERIKQAIDRARSGKIANQKHDGKPYTNIGKDTGFPVLPVMPPGYYREWPASAPTDRRGIDRIIVGGDPRNPDVVYYWDHEKKYLIIYP